MRMMMGEQKKIIKKNINIKKQEETNIEEKGLNTKMES